MKTLTLVWIVLTTNIYDGVYVHLKRGDAIPNVALELHYYCRAQLVVLLIFL